MVHSRSLVALQNLLTVLPLDRWGSGRGLSTMWTALYANCGHCADVFALTGVLQVIAEKMTENEVNVSLFILSLSLPGSLSFSLLSLFHTLSEPSLPSSLSLSLSPSLPLSLSSHKIILYSWKIWQEIKFGSLAVYITNAKLRSAKISYSHIHVHMAIPYRTAKFKSANIFAIAILDSTAKFNFC